MLLTVHEGHRDLVGETTPQLWVLIDVAGFPGNAARCANISHHLQRYFTQVAVLSDENENTRFTHSTNSSQHRLLPRGVYFGPMTIGAFFDLDNTLVRGTSLIHLATAMYRRGYFSTPKIARGLAMEAQFRVRGSEDMNNAGYVRQAFLDAISGSSAADLEQTAAEVFDNKLAERIWPGARELAEAHLAAGHEVWLMTASPVEVANVIADRLGLTGARGTVAGRDDDGNYTGQLDDFLHGSRKATAVAALIEERGIDAKASHAYSDSINDLGMLELVGNPHAVNPDAELLEVAELQSWPVHDYRSRSRWSTLR